MTDRPTLPTRPRCAIAFAMALWFAGALLTVPLGTGLWFGYSLPANVLSSAPQSAMELVPHSSYCHCAHCPGGKLCCCRPTANPANGLMMRACCDRDLPVNIPGVMPKMMPGQMVAVAADLDYATTPVNFPAPRDSRFDAPSISPLGPPPRLS